MARGHVILFLLIYIGEPISVNGFCDIISHGYGFRDEGVPYVSIQLNGEHVYYLDETSKRGVHIGLINITNCMLVEQPVLCDFFGSETANDCFQDTIATYTTLDEDTLIVIVTGKCFLSCF